MLKKIFTLSMLLLCVLLFANMSLAQSHPSVGMKYNGDAVVGDNPHKFNVGPPVVYHDPPGPRVFHLDGTTITTQEVSTDGRTYYDLQSNGLCRYIWQDVNNKNVMHAVFMIDPIYASGNPDRRTRYFYSEDTGHTWISVSEVPSLTSVRSGYPGVLVLSDGREVVGNHTALSGPAGTELRVQLFIDGSPGAGTFTQLDAGITGNTGDEPVWFVGAPTSSISLTNKIVFCAGELTGDSLFRKNCTGLTTPGVFTPYVWIPGGAVAESYSVAAGPSGKMCIAYITDATHLATVQTGGIQYIESTDNGTTWGAPVNVFTPQYDVDSLGAIRSIDVTYFGSNVRIVFGLCFCTNAGASFFPNLPSKEMIYGPDLNSGTPVLLDSCFGLTGSTPTNDVYLSCSRAVLGLTSDNLLCAAWSRGRADTDAVGNNFFDVYYSISINGGLTWQPRVQVTNLAGPLRDCRYPSISHYNFSPTFDKHFGHIIYQSDSVPGSHVQGSAMSLARMMYARVSVEGAIGIRNLGSDIPKVYTLNQNYPNPFNPTTNIKFSLPKATFVTLKIYDILGREVMTLINDNVPAGEKVITFDAAQLASGIYFYTIKAGDFRDTKKMILVK